MNKHIILAAAAAIALVSCTKQTTVPVVSEQEEISFQSCIAGESTKGDPVAFTDNMKVSAYFASDQARYFNNRVFTYSNGVAYKASPAAYWPVDPADGTTGLPLDFYAISSTKGIYMISDSTASTTNDTKIIKVDATYPLDGEDDIVAGYLANKSKGATDMVFDMGHKLTKVTLKVIGESINYKYVVSSVAVKALSTGIYNFSTDSWSNLATPKADYVYTLANPSGVTVPYNASDYVSLGASDYGLYLLPGQSSTTGTVTVTITYKVYQLGSGSDVFKYELTRVFDLSDSASTEWTCNKSIIYKLILNS